MSVPAAYFRLTDPGRPDLGHEIVCHAGKSFTLYLPSVGDAPTEPGMEITIGEIAPDGLVTGLVTLHAESATVRNVSFGLRPGMYFEVGAPGQPGSRATLLRVEDVPDAEA
jgi:hypothetical protein